MKEENKTFEGDFYLLLDKLKRGENFSFSRYSDGEMLIMKNTKLVLGPGKVQIGNNVKNGGYSRQDHKNFDPNIHSFFKDKLIESYKFRKNNYYKGLSCRCCVGKENYEFMREMYGEYDSYLTWANLWVNGNYPRFINEFVPELSKKKVIMVVNEMADLTNTPFNIVKDFRVGYNCIINNYNLIEEMLKWIEENKIENHVFLFSASSLSCYLAHQLFEKFDNNTYIDIGTTLNNYIKMDINRGYLLGYWKGGNKKTLNKICIW